LPEEFLDGGERERSGTLDGGHIWCLVMLESLADPGLTFALGWDAFWDFVQDFGELFLEVRIGGRGDHHMGVLFRKLLLQVLLR
jgi:hypothetical protein